MGINKGENAKKDCLWQHLRHAWHFRQVFRHRQQARYTAKMVGWIQEKGQTYYCDPSTLQNVRGKWQLIGKKLLLF